MNCILGNALQIVNSKAIVKLKNEDGRCRSEAIRINAEGCKDKSCEDEKLRRQYANTEDRFAIK